jgi:hypothetical protein
MTDQMLLSGAGVIFIIIFSFYQFFYLPRTFYEALTGPHYFIELFIPICIVLLWPSYNKIGIYPAKVAFMLALFIPVVGASVVVARDALITTIELIRSDTVSFTQIRTKLAGMVGRGSLAVDGFFVPAIEGDVKKLLVGTFRTSQLMDGEMSDMWGQERAELEACVIVIKQSNTGLEAPPDIAGFDMIETTFSSPVRLFGFTFYRTPKGYNYAVYHRVTCH